MISELTDAIIDIKKIEVEGATIEDFRSAMVEMRTALIHFQGELIAAKLTQPDSDMSDLANWTKNAIDLSNAFSLIRDQGLDSKTLATLYYTLALLANFEALIDGLTRFKSRTQGQLPK